MSKQYDGLANIRVGVRVSTSNPNALSVGVWSGTNCNLELSPSDAVKFADMLLELAKKVGSANLDLA